LKTCGRPGEPPCKIDETGTPGDAAVPGILGPAIGALDAAAIDLVAGINAQGPGGTGSKSVLPWVPAGLLLPSASCTPFSVTVRGNTYTTDPCSSDLVATYRSMVGWLLFMLTVLYCWRSLVSSAPGGH